MLIIRDQQLAILKRSFFDEIVRDAMDHLGRRFDAAVVLGALDDVAFYVFVRDGIKTAHRYGIMHRNDVLFYLECMVLLGRNFDTDVAHEWAAEILTDPALTGIEKVHLMSDHLVFARVSI